MRTAILPLAMGLMAGLASAFPVHVHAEGPIAWQDNLRTAHAEAQKSGKLLLLHFYGDNCPWCDKLEAGAFQTSMVGEAITKTYVPVKIHVGKNPSLAKMFKVKSMPTDVLVTTEGKVLSHKSSPQDPRAYVAMLDEVGSQNAGPATAGPGADPRARIAQANPANSNAAPAPPTVVAGQPANVPQGVKVNAYALPNQPAGQTAGQPSPGIGQTVGVRTDAMTLGGHGTEPIGVQPSTDSVAVAQDLAVQAAAAMPSATATPAEVPATGQATPPLALEGFCAVSIHEDYQWTEGKPEFGVIHLGRLYLFADQDKLQKFMDNPEPYTPVMNEIDVVRFFEERKIVPGKRDYGVKDPVHGRMFFFADQAARDHFENQFERYTDAAISVMQQAVRDANPKM